MLLIDALEQTSRSFIEDAPAFTQTTTRPRIDLQTGRLAGQSAQWPVHTPVPQILDAACAVARSSGAPVSIPAPRHPATLLAAVREAIVTATLPPDHLELTFSAAMLGDAGTEMLLALSALRDEGVALALEDFGPSGIALAGRLPFSCVILARSCIVRIPDAPAALAPLCKLIDLAHSHCMAVVATGIETETQRAVLSALGCDFGEGALFGPDTEFVGAPAASPGSPKQ